MELDEIENKIACNKLNAAQVFTQMQQHVIFYKDKAHKSRDTAHDFALSLSMAVREIEVLGIEEYIIERPKVNNDKFIADRKDTALSFPCCVCIYRHGEDTEEPCNKCGHNLNADT